MVDTGASCSCVDASALAPLGLTPTGQMPISTPSTQGVPASFDTFDVLLLIPGADGATPLVFQTIPLVALPSFAGPNYQGLIGRDVLASCILHYNGVTNLFELAY